LPKVGAHPIFQGIAGINKTPMDIVRRWSPVIIWLGFVFFMSTGTFSAENTFSVVGPILNFLFPGLSSDRVETIHWIIRKGAHLFEYFILGLLLLRAFRAGSSAEWRWRWCLCAAIGVLLWALGDEFHQLFVPNRTASMRDVGIDTAGGLFAQAVGAFWYLYLGRPYSRKP
jgi:VanZ family protein